MTGKAPVVRDRLGRIAVQADLGPEGTIVFAPKQRTLLIGSGDRCCRASLYSYRTLVSAIAGTDLWASTNAANAKNPAIRLIRFILTAPYSRLRGRSVLRLQRCLGVIA